jgi:hypothetical protein
VEIPEGLTISEEWEAIRRMQRREVKAALVDWLLGMATWRTKMDLTFEGVAHPERAEKAVRRLLGRLAPRGLAVVGYERQERGACHAHLLTDEDIPPGTVEAFWNAIAGFCRVGRVRSQGAALRYLLKHAVKGMDYEVIDGRAAPLARREEVVWRR